MDALFSKGERFIDARASPDMAGRHTRNLIRVLTGAALCTALATCAVAPTPENLPAVAFGQVGLYRLEIALMVFYGVLLLLTPTYSGLAKGRLPVEISTRGAKFADDMDQQAKLAVAAIDRLEQATAYLAEELGTANEEIKRLQEGLVTTGD